MYALALARWGNPRAGVLSGSYLCLVWGLAQGEGAPIPVDAWGATPAVLLLGAPTPRAPRGDHGLQASEHGSRPQAGQARPLRMAIEARRPRRRARPGDRRATRPFDG